MRRSLRLAVSEAEYVLKQWALEHDYLDKNELAVVFRVTDGHVTSVEMSCDEDATSEEEP